MLPKVAAKKKPQGLPLPEPVLHPYEVQRLARCMSNNARLKQFGILELAQEVANTSSTTTNNSKTNHGNREDSDNEYDPAHDDTGEGDLFDDENTEHGWKNSKNTCRTTKKRTAHMPPSKIIPRSKRVSAVRQSVITTRSKASIAQPNSSEINVSSDGHPDLSVEAHGPDHFDGNTHITNGGDATARTDGHNHHMANGDGDVGQLDGGMANGVDGGQNHMVNEEGRKERQKRGPNIGRGLHRMNRARRGKLPLFIPEGKIRPVVPLVSAKFASECNIIVRNHVPVLKRWKYYKDQPGLFKLFTGKLSAKFDINSNDVTIEKACMEMMRNAVRQQRHRLKKKYFDPFPLHLVPKTSPVKSMTNEQWNDLVESWTSPKKMETCEKNKENRDLVHFHQTTGSCSYMVLVENLGNKYNDEESNDEETNDELDALYLFKELHYSKKKHGYTPTVQSAITAMENKLASSTEAGQPNSTQVVADVLAEKTKKNQFLKNVGIQKTSYRSKAQDIEAQLAAKQRANDKLSSQVEFLSEKLQDTEEARIRDKEEMKKKQAELEAKLERLLP